MAELIVFFSREGNNYVNGAIKNLPIGNTEVAAEFVRDITGAELFKLEPVKPYALDYTECTNEAKRELNEKARPEAKAYPASLDGYDIIYLGYPNWWGTMPMCVFTFLERFDFTGKTIKPFCTHEGSGMGHSEADIRRVCPGAKVENGLAIHGADVAGARSAFENWIKK